MKRLAALTLLGLAISTLAVHLLVREKPAADRVFFSASSEIRETIQKVAAQYEREFGAEVIFGKPGEDLTIAPGVARGEGAIRETIPLTAEISVGVRETCQNPAAALRFARYLAAPEKGAKILREAGFEPIPGDAWEMKPELILYSGGVNRPAVEQLLTDFADREGITLTTVFNGCGILCAAMQTMSDPENPSFPDAYFACDVCFVPPVAEHFDEVVMLTETDIGIAVHKGNPHGIKTLTDLAKPGLKVGLCNQDQSTLGYMTQGILRSSGLETAIRKNVVVGVPTADFLINQMRAGSLDAAIVYRVNAQLQEQHIEFLKIDHQGARAVQPFSVRNTSRRHQLGTRLQEHFLAHPEAFEETGFIWRGDDGPVKSADIEVPPWLLKGGAGSPNRQPVGLGDGAGNQQLAR